MTLITCPDCNSDSHNRLPKMTKNRVFHLGVGINRPQNGLFRNGRVKFFKCPKILRAELQFDGKNLLLRGLCLPDGGAKKGL